SRHRIGRVEIEVAIGQTVMPFECALGWHSEGGRRDVWIRAALVYVDGRNEVFRFCADELAVVAITETGARSRVPQIERLRFGGIACAVQVRNETTNEVGEVCGR